MFHLLVDLLDCSFAALQLKTHLLSLSWMPAACLPHASSWIRHSSAHLDQAVVQFLDDIRLKRKTFLEIKMAVQAKLFLGLLNANNLKLLVSPWLQIICKLPTDLISIYFVALKLYSNSAQMYTRAFSLRYVS